MNAAPPIRNESVLIAVELTIELPTANDELFTKLLDPIVIEFELIYAVLEITRLLTYIAIFALVFDVDIFI